MQKIRILTLFIILAAILSLSVFANPPDIPEIFSQEISFSDISDISENSQKVTDALDINAFSKYFISHLKNIIGQIFSPFLTLLAIILLSSVSEIFCLSFTKSEYLCFATDAVVCVNVFTLILPLIKSVSDFLNLNTAFLSSMISTQTIILSTGGLASTAAVSSAASSFLIGVIQLLCISFVLPCVKALLSLDAIGVLSKSLDLSGVISFIKGFCSWALGLLFALFGGIYSASIAVSSGTDRLFIRGLRFSAARLIPVAGALVSESMQTVLAGISVIKNTAGGFGIAYIIYAFVPVLMKILAVKIIIMLSSASAKIAGAKRQAKLLSGVGSTLNLLLAVSIFASVSGILVFAVFMNISVSS